MRKAQVLPKLAAASGSAMLGGFCGALLSAVGNSISGSSFGVGVTIAVTVLVGGWMGRFWGAILGGVCGVLLVALGSLIGGSILGIVLTILSCALLGGWLRWIHEDRQDARRVSAPVDFRPAARELTAATHAEHYEKELAPCC
jgi:hypothetical protein